MAFAFDPPQELTPRLFQALVAGPDRLIFHARGKLAGVEKPVTISMRNLVGRKVLERGDNTVIAWEEGSLVLFF